MRVKLKVEGTDEVRRRLERLAVETAQEYIREAGHAGAEIIQEEASQRVNLGPHADHLRDSIVIQETRERNSRLDFAVGPDSRHWYGRLVEFGHAVIRVTGRYTKGGVRQYRILKQEGNVPPHPFLRPAFDDKRKEANTKVAEVLRRRLGL